VTIRYPEKSLPGQAHHLASKQNFNKKLPASFPEQNDDLSGSKHYSGPHHLRND